MAVAIMGKTIRLDKYLTEMNKGSRSQIKEAAKKGRIQVNGQTEKKTDRKIDPQADQVLLDGKPVAYHAYEYYMLNKPQGVVSATEDRIHKTVIDLLGGEIRRDLFPVGRLDIDTEGLLLLTNDGELAHQLLSPKKHVDKQYYARVAGTLPPDSKEQIAAGMTLSDGTQVMPGELSILTPVCECGEASSETEILLTIREGKFHQVKRMFEALGCQVVFLKRLSMGSLRLDESLRPGEFRKLTEDELEGLKEGSEKAGHPDSDFEQKETGQKIPELLKGKEAVIFDLDGTLVDSMWMWKQIDIEYLGRFGYECPPQLQKEIEGMSFSETAVYFKEKFQIPDSLEEIKQCWVDMSIEKYRCQVPMKKGARRFLSYLKENGFRAGIATSNGRAMVDAVLHSLDMEAFFQVITTACEVAAGKPAPDIYQKVAKTLQVPPEKCLVFEDVPAGIMAGKAAGMTVCAIEDEFSAPMREEKLALADYYIEDYDEIFDKK